MLISAAAVWQRDSVRHILFHILFHYSLSQNIEYNSLGYTYIRTLFILPIYNSLHLLIPDRGWDGWMASLTQWTWVWVDSGSWWWTGRPGVLRFMGSQRVGHDWATELNWTESQTPNHSLLHFHPQWQAQICSLHWGVYFCFIDRFNLRCIFDSTYKWYHMAFVFLLWLISFSTIISRSIHAACK